MRPHGMRRIGDPAGGKGASQEEITVFVGDDGGGRWKERQAAEPSGNGQRGNCGETCDRMPVREARERNAQA